MQARDFRRGPLHDAQHSFTIDGKRYSCQFSATDADVTLSSDGGGTMDVYDLVATVIKSDFRHALPEKGITVIADGKSYQVEKTQSIPLSPLAKIYFTNLDT
jgi:hypothetical protein